jgi:hypothetical protein
MMTFYFLLSILLLDVITAMAQSPGAFTPAGGMSTPRAGHTSTLLLNGKILIAGGLPDGFHDPLVSAELYGPTTGAFTQTGAMMMARTQHTATLLADGRVLITGGRGPIVAGRGAQDLASAEIYDPNTGAFTPTGNMVTLRGLHAATLLADGRVLVVGCAIPCNSAIAEVYDPATGTFAGAGIPGAGGDTTTLLADGNVLITGGCPADFHGTEAQLYDPSFGTFRSTGLMPTGCANINMATLLLTGQVLIEGSDEYPDPAAAALYDPPSGTFAGVGPAIRPREYSAAVLVPDGSVLTVGGQLPGGNGDPSAELYSPASGTFALIGSMSTARHSNTATLLPDGTVLIAGGYSVWPGATASAEIYRPTQQISPPILYSTSGDGRGQGAVLHASNHQLVSPDNPAAADEPIEIYGTGLIGGALIPPRVSIGGRMAQVLFFGQAPGYAGLNQVNVRVPGGVAAGDAVPVRLNYLSRPSNEVTISVR